MLVTPSLSLSLFFLFSLNRLPQTLIRPPPTHHQMSFFPTSWDAVLCPLAAAHACRNTCAFLLSLLLPFSLSLSAPRSILVSCAARLATKCRRGRRRDASDETTFFCFWISHTRCMLLLRARHTPPQRPLRARVLPPPEGLCNSRAARRRRVCRTAACALPPPSPFPLISSTPPSLVPPSPLHLPLLTPIFCKRQKRPAPFLSQRRPQPPTSPVVVCVLSPVIAPAAVEEQQPPRRATTKSTNSKHTHYHIISPPSRSQWAQHSRNGQRNTRIPHTIRLTTPPLTSSVSVAAAVVRGARLYFVVVGS